MNFLAAVLRIPINPKRPKIQSYSKAPQSARQHAARRRPSAGQVVSAQGRGETFLGVGDVTADLSCENKGFGFRV